MLIPTHVSFRLDHSASVEDLIRREIERLNARFWCLTAVRVVVEPGDGKRSRHVAIELTVPGRQLVVKRIPKALHVHQSLHGAVCDAFDRAERQLEHYLRSQHRRRARHRDEKARNAFLSKPEAEAEAEVLSLGA